MISEFEKYLTWERLENFKIHERNSQQKISTILDNTYSINNNLEMIYKEVKKPDPPRHYETIIETPAYERFVQRQKQKVYEDELKAKKNAEYEEFIEWKKQQQLKKGKMKETKDIPSFLREEEPVQIKEDTTSQLLEMMKEIRKELDEIKEKQRQKEEEKVNTIQQEEGLDPDDLEPELLKLEINKVEREETEEEITSEKEEEIISEEEIIQPDEYINVKIEQDEYKYQDEPRTYKPRDHYYQGEIRRQRAYKKPSYRRSEYINNRREQFEPTYKSNLDTTITANGEILSLDCVTPTEAEENKIRIMKIRRNL
ncbi:trichohyalin-like [Capsicum annuum]|uniref:trichohyalin-like n=1 Tax=Capsicum annuum TaxID=4072 RepID=UPI001FB0DFB3|nr:trichohyalin-like [Capsicum annuum]